MQDNLISRRRLMTSAAAAAWAFAWSRASEAQSAVVDTVFVNGKVYTVDPRFSVVQAFAVSGGRFAATGSNADIRKLGGANARVIDLGGRSVFPGFVDTHPHVVARGRQLLADPSLAGANSVAAILERVSRAAASREPDAWIVTSPIGQPPDYHNLPEGLAEKRWPTLEELDKAAPRNPVYITTSPYWPHPAFFNTQALKLLGVTGDTPDEPPLVKIVRDSGGEPTGRIFGFHIYNRTSALLGKLRALLPPPPPADRVLAALARVFEQNMAVGLVTVYEAHGGNPSAFHGPFDQLRTTDKATGRAVTNYEVPKGKSSAELATWMEDLNDAKGAGTGDDYFKTVGITVSVDGGAVQFGRASFHEPYLDPLGQPTTGGVEFSQDELNDVARMATKHDLRLNILAAGPKAIDMAVEAMEVANRETPIRDKQWVVQHVQNPSREAIAKFAAMGVMAQTYASADYSKGAETYVKRFPGKDIWKTVVPLRWWLDAGVVVAGSSDGAHYDPMFQIWETLARVDGWTGKSLLTPEKTVTRQEAVQIHTINGAKLAQWEDRIGSIEAGKHADFVVVDRDIMTIPLDQIPETKAVLTAVGGKVFHDPLSLMAKF